MGIRGTSQESPPAGIVLQNGLPRFQEADKMTTMAMCLYALPMGGYFEANRHDYLQRTQ